MSGFLVLMDLLWIFGAACRLGHQMDSALRLMAKGQLDRPSLRSLAADAALWWLWMALDFARWIGREL